MSIKDIQHEFMCNLKQDTFHAIGDQASFWTFRLFYSLSDVQIHFGVIESFMFYHGWLILLIWRICNAALDTYKRVRDVSKPEWKTQVRPLLIAEEKRSREKSAWTKFLETLKMIFK